MSSCAELVEEEVSFVKPAAGAAGRRHGYLYLSSLDLYWRGTPYSRRLLFYDNVDDQDAMVAKLKSSLAQVLLPFYPAAGRLVSARPPAAYPARPSILCDGQGVEFIVAHVDAPLSLRHWALFPSLARAYPPLHDVDPHVLPLLSIQVTKFLCGGLAIGIAYSNVLADGHSFWHLMNSWAECARDEAISIQPFHNREVFKVENPSREGASQLFPPTCNISIHENISPITRMPKVFHFSPLMINKIKSQAYEGHGAPNEASFSDYDVLCAFVWKSAISSQTPSKLDHSSTNICVLGDMRFRMKPQLPRGYFGNSTIFAYASSSIQDMKEGSFGFISQQIHEACKACNESRLWEIVSWLELHDNFFDAKKFPWMVADMNVVSSPKFKVYNVDFGWGKPIAMRPPQISNTRDMFLLPGRHGGIDVCILWPTPLVNQLLHNFNELML
ncbi:hypothetical protein GOP47_0030095 [Adiantum capillus-veneris]|nr:hypothetical protein GOP47_0030095 [Adiantum capillus-veneris]